MEVDEIPSEMSTIARRAASEWLDVACKRMASINFESSKSSEVLSEIDSIRALLLKVDERLSDIDAIMKGYYSQQSAAFRPEAEPIKQPSEHQLPVNQEAMAEIQARLTEHRTETEALKRTFNRDWSDDEEGV
tara:strand:+ start:984 stop:1382 length:399 start_codon:yes stop_codon:yes gene_type:complete